MISAFRDRHNIEVETTTYKSYRDIQIHKRLTHKKKEMETAGNIFKYCKSLSDTEELMKQLVERNKSVELITNKYRGEIIGLLITNKEERTSDYKHETLAMYLNRVINGVEVRTSEQRERMWENTYELMIMNKYLNKHTVLGVIGIIRREHGFGKFGRLTFLCSDKNAKLTEVIHNCGFRVVGKQVRADKCTSYSNVIYSLPCFKKWIDENNTPYIMVEGL